MLGTTTKSFFKNQVLLTWLREKDIPCSETMFKSEMYELVKMNKSYHEQYYFDEILDKYKILIHPLSSRDESHRIIFGNNKKWCATHIVTNNNNTAKKNGWREI